MAIGLLILLSGCALLTSYELKFDPIEYKAITDIRTSANLAKNKCDDPVEIKNQSNLISIQTLSFMNYEQYIPYNDNARDAAIELDQIVRGLRDQYKKNIPVSIAFCKIKFDHIEQSAELMQKSIGGKPR